MKEYWQEDALDYVKRILRQQSVFAHTYQAMLSYTPARFSFTFKVAELCLSKALKRLVTIHNYEPISELPSSF